MLKHLELELNVFYLLNFCKDVGMIESPELVKKNHKIIHPKQIGHVRIPTLSHIKFIFFYFYFNLLFLLSYLFSIFYFLYLLSFNLNLLSSIFYL